jgi:LysR family transcriptional regulator (chromosome initiation inhibitor)
MILRSLKLCFTLRMQIDPLRLETLMTILDEGSFEAAARELQVTPSAVSQRVRALERDAGQVLLRRTSPVTVTPAGEPLARLGRQMRLLVAEAASHVEDRVATLAVAVNADSLATWFRPVLAAVALRHAVSLRLHVVNESVSHELLRGGEVLAAVTSEPRPLGGCTVQGLGVLRHLPVATPRLLERHRHSRRVDWEAMPVVVFDKRDTLHVEALAPLSVERMRVVHHVPSSDGALDAVRCGLGWGMVPEPQAAPGLRAGELVRLPGTRPVDVMLHWQRWRLDSPMLSALTEDVRAAANTGLRRARRPPAT